MPDPPRPEPRPPCPDRDDREGRLAPLACPACGGRLVAIKAKLQCERCRAIVETCCEGGPG